MSQVYLGFAAPDLSPSPSPKEGGELLKRFSATIDEGRCCTQTLRPFPLGKGTGGRSGWLTPREASLFAEIKSLRRRRDWLAGRYAAKELIRSYLLERAGLALPCSQIEILNDEHGAPRALLPLNVEISIAHSAGHGLAGLCAQGPIGVDLQQIRSVRPDLIRRVLSERERAQLAQHFARNSIEGTLVFWALKEAAIKAQKSRPAPAFCEIAVRLTEPGHAEILVRSQRLRAQWGRWREFIWAWAAGYSLSSTMVTPSPPWLGGAESNLFTMGSDAKCLRISLRKTPVPFPCTIYPRVSPASTKRSR